MINIEAGTWGDTHICVVIYDPNTILAHTILANVELYKCGHLVPGDNSKGFCNCKNGIK